MTYRGESEQSLTFWRRMISALAVLSLLGIYGLLPPILQDEAYHAFVDQRFLWAVPRALDVLSNLPFVLIGWAGILACRGLPGLRGWVWRVLMLGIALVGVGSAYYHWAPTSARLVWDRLPMAISFMLLFALVLERSLRLPLLPLAVGLPLVGLGSILLWVVTGDLRLYGWVQFLPIVAMPLLWWRFPLRDGQQPYQQYYWALVFWYGLAKLLEHFDAVVFDLLLGVVSGHSLKHLAAAAGVYQLVLLVRGEVKAVGGQAQPAKASPARADG